MNVTPQRRDVFVPKWIRGLAVSLLAVTLVLQAALRDTPITVFCFIGLGIVMFLLIGIAAPRRLMITKLVAFLLAVVLGPIVLIFYMWLPIEKYNPRVVLYKHNPFPILILTWLVTLAPLGFALFVDRRIGGSDRPR